MEGSKMRVKRVKRRKLSDAKRNGVLDFWGHLRGKRVQAYQTMFRCETDVTGVYWKRGVDEMGCDGAKGTDR